MSRHLAFRRQPVAPQVAQNLKTATLPAPTRGIGQNENLAYMQPGGSIVQENWVSTMRGVKLRGGFVRWSDLHSLDAGGAPPVPSPTRKPVISAFEYISGGTRKMFAANATNLFDVTSSTPILVKGSQGSGNYAAAQMSNQGGDWLIAVNDAGNAPLRYNGSTWAVLDPAGLGGAAWLNSHAYTVGNVAIDTTTNTYWNCLVGHTSPATGTFEADRIANPGRWAVAVTGDGAPFITGPPGSVVQNGGGLTYIWKYRNRLFYIEGSSMNAWFGGIDAVGGGLQQIPLAGSATSGGNLLFGAVWSLDAGDGTDDKCVFATDLGELLIFSGTNPADPDHWKQEGRYQVSPPLGMNAHIQIGGDLLILTVDGIVPISQAITKTAGQLELAMLTRMIKNIWRSEVAAKRGNPWTIKKWDEYGGVFVTTPGGAPGNRYCLVANNATGAWAKLPGIDATCFLRLREDMFFGTQDGIVMQAERTGYDDGNHARTPYTATLVGGWETFGVPSAQVVWHQSRAVFTRGINEPFKPALNATVDYNVKIPPAPSAGFDPGTGTEGWDVGQWDAAHWDAVPAVTSSTITTTRWVSIGKTGYAHAPIVQVTIGQSVAPSIELIAMSVVYEPAGVNVD